MTTFSLPLFLAPMAGGPSTPELCACVSQAGGVGFLAGGYLTQECLQQDVEQTRTLTQEACGVNLFVPEPERDVQSILPQWQTYREELLGILPPEYADLLPSAPQYSDYFFADKLKYLISAPVDYVSFTFGYPGDDVVDMLQAQGKTVMVNTTSLAGVCFLERGLCS